jgi:hypothetical protein
MNFSPQWAQNLASVLLGLPQAAQFLLSSSPQDLHLLAPIRFSVWQEGQMGFIERWRKAQNSLMARRGLASALGTIGGWLEIRPGPLPMRCLHWGVDD